MLLCGLENTKNMIDTEVIRPSKRLDFQHQFYKKNQEFRNQNVRSCSIVQLFLWEFELNPWIKFDLVRFSPNDLQFALFFC